MINRIKLTDARVDRVPYKNKEQVLYWDLTLIGFGLRVGAKTKSFFCEKRVSGKTVRFTIGKYPVISTSDARKVAQKHLSDMTFGVDPRVKKRSDLITFITLEKVIDEFMDSRELTRETQIGYLQILKAVYGEWFKMPISLISKNMIERKHKDITTKGNSAYANRAARTLRSIFNFAIAKYEGDDGESVIRVNPVSRLSDARLWNRPVRRTGHLKPFMIKPWFECVNKIHNTVIGDYLKFILFTGVRRSEAAKLTWSNVSGIDRSFTLIDTKNHTDIELPMSGQITDIIINRWNYRENDFVFPATRSVSGHVEEPRKAVVRIGGEINHHFTIHDLRRTFITFAESLDISHYALKALVNHRMSASDVTAGYVQMSVDRLREPMQRISDYIAECSKS